MTEAEWLTSINLNSMKRFLAGKVSERKWRLFGCACCRRIWHLMPKLETRTAVEVAEGYADKLATLSELNAARQAAKAVARLPCLASRGSVLLAARAAAQCASRNGRNAGLGASGEVVGATVFAAFREGATEGKPRASSLYTVDQLEKAEQACILREIVGNLFRPAAVDPAWLQWNDGAVVSIARELAERGRFGELPVLADALEEAGCTDPDLLGHLRGPGPHVRGCFAVDLLLGKK